MSEARDAAPLIVTGELPPDLHRWATRLRTEHFPPERNHVDAHVTLFHALPPSLAGEVERVLATMAGEYAPPEAMLDSVMDLGGGTAFAIHSPGLLAIRDHVAERFHGMLTAQDGHTPRLHVTIQNKVARAGAKALQAELHAHFEPRAFAFAGLGLHRYRGGPWEHVRSYAFRGRERAD